jgi:hypothetical protein
MLQVWSRILEASRSLQCFFALSIISLFSLDCPAENYNVSVQTEEPAKKPSSTNDSPLRPFDERFGDMRLKLKEITENVDSNVERYKAKLDQLDVESTCKKLKTHFTKL